MKAINSLLAAVILTASAGPAWSTSITNGDFSAGLTGWNTVGPVSDGGGFALMEEDPVFMLTTIGQEFGILALDGGLAFDYTMTFTPDGTSGAVFPDAFTASLLDPVTFDPILSTPGFADYFYRDNRGIIDYDPSIVTLVGDTVMLDLTAVPGGTDALLAFDLLGADDGFATQATVDNVVVTEIPEPVTAIGAAMGLVSLGAYLRRRRA